MSAKFKPIYHLPSNWLLNQVRAHSRPKTVCGHTPGLLKLFSEKCVFVCMYVCMYICLSFRTLVSKALEVKSSLHKRNEGCIKLIGRFKVGNTCWANFFWTSRKFFMCLWTDRIRLFYRKQSAQRIKKVKSRVAQWTKFKNKVSSLSLRCCEP